ncbi:hypothetical protein KI387_000692, partial [Taxus chinensis]
DLEENKKWLKEIEEEATALRETIAKLEDEMGIVPEASGSEDSNKSRDEVDARSIYVGNVNYSCKPEDVVQHFKTCGTVNRVTILTDDGGYSKGYAYLEFLEHNAVEKALELNGSEFHGRQLMVNKKRTNIPGISHFHVQPWIPPYPYDKHCYG